MSHKRASPPYLAAGMAAPGGDGAEPEEAGDAAAAGVPVPDGARAVSAGSKRSAAAAAGVRVALGPSCTTPPDLPYRVQSEAPPSGRQALP